MFRSRDFSNAITELTKRSNIKEDVIRTISSFETFLGFEKKVSRPNSIVIRVGFRRSKSGVMNKLVSITSTSNLIFSQVPVNN